MIKIGKCAICNEMFPPDFTIIVNVDAQGNEDYKCVYCESGKDVLAYDTGRGMRDYKKKECIEDYKGLLMKLKSSPEVTKALADKGM